MGDGERGGRRRRKRLRRSCDFFSLVSLPGNESEKNVKCGRSAVWPWSELAWIAWESSPLALLLSNRARLSRSDQQVSINSISSTRAAYYYLLLFWFWSFPIIFMLPISTMGARPLGTTARVSTESWATNYCTYIMCDVCMGGVGGRGRVREGDRQILIVCCTRQVNCNTTRQRHETSNRSARIRRRFQPSSFSASAWRSRVRPKRRFEHERDTAVEEPQPRPHRKDNKRQDPRRAQKRKGEARTAGRICPHRLLRRGSQPTRRPRAPAPLSSSRRRRAGQPSPATFLLTSMDGDGQPTKPINKPLEW